MPAVTELPWNQGSRQPASPDHHYPALHLTLPPAVSPSPDQARRYMARTVRSPNTHSSYN